MMFQSTHPFGCDIDIDVFFLFFDVSIHAPVWVRLERWDLTRPSIMFQSTHPFGCDCGAAGLGISGEVSIHAPVWVRLNLVAIQRADILVSIHAPVWVRPNIAISIIRCFTFQSTHPFGCD